MSTLAEEIDQLESRIFNLIDELNFCEHCGGCESLELKDELTTARLELLKKQLQFEKECDSYRVCNL
jgi:hypothetical protein